MLFNQSFKLDNVRSLYGALGSIVKHFDAVELRLLGELKPSMPSVFGSDVCFNLDQQFFEVLYLHVPGFESFKCSTFVVCAE